MRFRLAAVLACAALVPLTGCGSSDSESASSAASSTSAAASSTGSVSSASPTSSAPAGCPPASGAAKRTTSFASAPPMCIDAAKTYTAKVTSDAGDFTITLDAKKAPKTVNNFVFLARNHFYDGVTFHRVIKDFMAQGGDPEGTGFGGPGYTIPDEFPKEGGYEVGSVAMAKAMKPNTGGSQFFIVTGESGVQLPPQYSLFGKVTEGMSVVKKIEADGSEGDDVPAKTHTMKTVTITES